ncbi:MAG TPA: lasso peptide biosynthesis B2 protein [Solirubrobacteraceae bacterium]|nr:lasso peptide biosynthesis B2 protein [Solirubrobacteraceae bacterium]
MAVRSSEPHGAPATRVAVVGGTRLERLSHTARARLAVEILAAYAQSRRALRRAPIETVVASLRSRSPSAATPAAQSLAEARRLGRAVTRLLAHLPGDTRCLVRSLVLTRLLANRGIQAKLVIGARTTPTFLAHAWVEHDGHPVLDPGDEPFGRLVEL